MALNFAVFDYFWMMNGQFQSDWTAILRLIRSRFDDHVINGVFKTRPNVNRVSLMVNMNIDQKKIIFVNFNLSHYPFHFFYNLYNMHCRVNELLIFNFDFSEIQYLYNIFNNLVDITLIVILYRLSIIIRIYVSNMSTYILFYRPTCR